MLFLNGLGLLLYHIKEVELHAQTEDALTREIAHKYGSDYPIPELADGTEVDLLSKDYAFEVDFLNKWYEAIGQSQHYAKVLKMDPAIILLVSLPVSKREAEKIADAAYICGKNNIRLYLEFYEPNKP